MAVSCVFGRKSVAVHTPFFTTSDVNPLINFLAFPLPPYYYIIVYPLTNIYLPSSRSLWIFVLGTFYPERASTPPTACFFR